MVGVEMQPRDRPRVLTGEASSWYRAHGRRCDSLEMGDGVSCPGDLDKVAGFGTPCLDDSSRSVAWRGLQVTNRHLPPGKNQVVPSDSQCGPL